MALSIAREKDTKELDLNLLSRFASKARVPANPVVEIAIHTAEKLVTTWRRMKHDLPLDDEARRKIDEQLEYLPLTRQFIQKSTVPVTADNPQNRRGRPPKTPAIEHDIE